MNPNVDILLATYCGENYLQEQLHSLIQQTHSTFHLYVRDDCSEDQTENILDHFCQQHPKKATKLPSKQQLGARDNFFCLIESAQADYLMLCDQDDVWKQDKISKTLAKMKQMETVYGKQCPLLVHTDLTVVDAKLKLISPSFWSYSHLKPRDGRPLNRLLMQDVVTGCTMMINRALADILLPIPKEAQIHDSWIAWVAAAFGKIGTLKESTLLYRQHHHNQIGAQKFSHYSLIKHEIKQRFKRTDHSLKIRGQHASAFLNRYKKKLSKQQETMLNSLIELPDSSYFRSKYLILKHGFYYDCLIQNLLSFT